MNLGSSEENNCAKNLSPGPDPTDRFLGSSGRHLWYWRYDGDRVCFLMKMTKGEEKSITL